MTRSRLRSSQLQMVCSVLEEPWVRCLLCGPAISLVGKRTSNSAPSSRCLEAHCRGVPTQLSMKDPSAPTTMTVANTKKNVPGRSVYLRSWNRYPRYRLPYVPLRDGERPASRLASRSPRHLPCVWIYACWMGWICLLLRGKHHSRLRMEIPFGFAVSARIGATAGLSMVATLPSLVDFKGQV